MEERENPRRADLRGITVLMKRIILCLILSGALIFLGCGSEKAGSNLVVDNFEKPDFELSVESGVTKENCYICGEREDSLIPYYSNRDSLGIIHWNSLNVVDSDVRAYDDYGNELFGQNSLNMSNSSFGKGYGHIGVQGNPNRGMTDIWISYKDDDAVDFETLKSYICQDCLDKIVGFYIEQKNYGDDCKIGTTGYCLIDFATRELYTLSRPYCGYYIRDYYVRYDIHAEVEREENKIELFIVYVPVRVG